MTRIVARDSAIAEPHEPRVAADERDVRRLDRHVGAGPDRHAEVRAGERRGVVDPVADHRDPAALGLEPRHDASLSAGQHLRDDAVRRDPHGPATASAVARRVAGEQPDVEARRAQVADRLGATSALTGSADRDDARRRRRRSRRTTARPAVGADRRGRGSPIGVQSTPRSREQRRAADQRPAGPSTRARARPRPTIASKPSPRRARARRARPGPRSPRPAGARDALLERRGEVEQLAARRRRRARRDRRRPSGRPAVSVPVLSKTTVSIRPAASSASPPRTRIPASAPRPVPTMIAVGVARPIAHGQAMITTPMNAVSARVSRGSGPNANQATNVSAATTRTAGTNTSLIRSARRWIGALEPCARWTSSTIRARAVSRPTRVARMTNEPVVLSVAPMTSSPARFVDGQRLAGEHRLVDGGGALHDDAVDRDAVAGPDAEQVARHDERQLDVRLDAVADPAGGRRLEADQPPDRAGRAALGPGLEPSPEQHEAEDDRRGVEVAAGSMPAAITTSGHRVTNTRVGPSRGRADGDQRVHRRAAVPPRPPRSPVEALAGPDLDERRRAAGSSRFAASIAIAPWAAANMTAMNARAAPIATAAWTSVRRCARSRSTSSAASSASRPARRVSIGRRDGLGRTS